MALGDILRIVSKKGTFEVAIIQLNEKLFKMRYYCGYQIKEIYNIKNCTRSKSCSGEWSGEEIILDFNYLCMAINFR